MDSDLLLHGRVALPGGADPVPGWVALAGERIAGAGTGMPAASRDARTVDLGDRVIAPGFVDLHVHGGAGGQAAGEDPAQVADAVRRAAAFHAGHGTTCLLATTVSDTPERLRATVAGIRAAMDTPDPAAAVVAGVHLEGPWLAPARLGAHDPATLRLPDEAELDALVAAGGAAVRLITLAPELEGAQAVIAAATAHGIIVSVGHTEATYDQARAAFDAGARHLTHLGNAMRVLDRREPGPIGAALTDERVTVEVIADGQHVHPAVLRLVAQAAPERLVAITDAIAATGLPDGAHRLGELAVTVRDGRAVLTERPQTLAGSVLTMDGAVAGLVAAGVPVGVALRAATATPARVLSDPARGVLAAGARADLVVLDDAFRARATVIGGRAVHDPEHLLATDPASRA
jgi:N-acetylglucosamine-6-phosphate deacetylase